MRKLLFLAVLLAGLVGLGAKPVPGMQLILENRTWLWYDQLYGITCYHEDSNHQRLWMGSIAAGGSFTVPLEMCPIYGVPYVMGPGSASFLMWSYARDGLELIATAPSGRVYVARSTMEGKPTRNLLTRCVLPDTHGGTIGVGTLEPGTYVVELRNTSSRTIRDIEFMVHVQLAANEFQQASCDPADWNFD